MGLFSTLPHRNTHKTGGRDALTPADIGAASLVGGKVPADQLPSGPEFQELTVYEKLIVIPSAIPSEAEQQADLWAPSAAFNELNINGTVIAPDENGVTTVYTPLAFSDPSAVRTALGAASALFSTDLPGSTMSQAVGGAPAQTAATWETKSVNQILGDILFPTVLPTYTVPTAALSFNPALPSIFEVGQNYSGVVTATFIKNDAGAFSGAYSVSRSGASGSKGDTGAATEGSATDVPDQFYPNPNNPNRSYARTLSENFTLAFGTTSWVGNSFQGYLAGLAKKDNKGLDDTRTPSVRSANAPQAASSPFSSATVNANAIYPWFWGKASSQPTKSSIAAAIAGGGANRILASANGTLSITFAASNEFIWFALPQFSPLLSLPATSATPAKTKWYVNETNQGNIESTGLFAPAGATQAVDAPLVSPETTRRWTGVQYQIYISNFATTTSGVMQIREN